PEDQSGSGLHATPYRYNWNGGAYGSYTSDSTPAVTVVDGDSADSDMQIRDKVGNVATIDGEDITIDDDTPEDFTITWTRHTGTPDGFYAYLSGSNIYYKEGESDYFTITVNNNGEIGNSGLFATEWDKNGCFAGGENDTDPLPEQKLFYYGSVYEGALFLIRLINNAGNYQEWSFTPVSDTTAPTIGTWNMVLTADTDSDGGDDIAPQSGYYEDDYGDTWSTTSPNIVVGREYFISQYWNYHGFICIDTGVNVEIDSFSANSFQLW
ncbi:unnamed protein product, partial [marine sediment metagenome]